MPRSRSARECSGRCGRTFRATFSPTGPFCSPSRRLAITAICAIRSLLAAQTQARLTEARLDALKAQLNPHFFFNTLNAISALALRGDHAAVVDTLTRLGNLVRISLDSKRPHQIALEQEMEFLDGYLEIVRLSIGERLTVEYQRQRRRREGAGAQHNRSANGRNE